MDAICVLSSSPDIFFDFVPLWNECLLKGVAQWFEMNSEHMNKILNHERFARYLELFSHPDFNLFIEIETLKKCFETYLSGKNAMLILYSQFGLSRLPGFSLSDIKVTSQILI